MLKHDTSRTAEASLADERLRRRLIGDQDVDHVGAKYGAKRKKGRIVAHVFHRNGKPIKSCVKAWKSACEAVGLQGRLVHDLRHSAVRNLERAGVSRSVAMQLTGHKTEAVYRRYAITAAADLSEGAAKFAALHGAA